ncbi:hypothetical protein [Streptomyces palmae]|uniref:hypothetical protein n=1 Tax=Streptomyces palmae TaxID=1701085 RepID=UPI001AE09BAC|nr:hypothetical protein [Streptomyces palmae]
MNTGLKATAFAAALAAAFGAAYGVGHAVEPISDPSPAAHAGHGSGQGGAKHTGEEGTEPKGGHAGHTGDSAEEHPPGGLQTTEDGYTLDLHTPRVEAGDKTVLRFTVRDQDGRPVTAYRANHGKDLHLILAGRDLAGYRHLHPNRDADGTWSLPVTLDKAGDYRLFADFTPDAKGAKDLTLGADLAAAGHYTPTALPKSKATTTVDGYTVTRHGQLTPGKTSELTFTVTKKGRPVTDLQPYLEAYGHLVALRSGDLAYLHVHPNGAPGDGHTRPGPDISFSATAPSTGNYRLYLDFRADGKVHTAAFTLPATGTPAAADHAKGGSSDEHAKGDDSGDHAH